MVRRDASRREVLGEDLQGPHPTDPSRGDGGSDGRAELLGRAGPVERRRIESDAVDRVPEDRPGELVGGFVEGVHAAIVTPVARRPGGPGADLQD